MVVLYFPFKSHLQHVCTPISMYEYMWIYADMHIKSSTVCGKVSERKIQNGHHLQIHLYSFLYFILYK